MPINSKKNVRKSNRAKNTRRSKLRSKRNIRSRQSGGSTFLQMTKESREKSNRKPVNKIKESFRENSKKK